MESLSMNRLVVLFVVFLLSSLALTVQTGNANDAFPQCAELNGPAKGLCNAAANMDCQGSASDLPACADIAEAYLAITGTQPPWASSGCPCWSLDELILVGNSGDGSDECVEYAPYGPDSAPYIVAVTGNNVANNGSEVDIATALYESGHDIGDGKGFKGWACDYLEFDPNVGRHVHVSSEQNEEFVACQQSILVEAAARGLECLEPPPPTK
jgi:hypothetical protein